MRPLAAAAAALPALPLHTWDVSRAPPLSTAARCPRQLHRLLQAAPIPRQQAPGLHPLLPLPLVTHHPPAALSRWGRAARLGAGALQARAASCAPRVHLLRENDRTWCEEGAIGRLHGTPELHGFAWNCCPQAETLTWWPHGEAHGGSVGRAVHGGPHGVATVLGRHTHVLERHAHGMSVWPARQVKGRYISGQISREMSRIRIKQIAI